MYISCLLISERCHGRLCWNSDRKAASCLKGHRSKSNDCMLKPFSCGSTPFSVCLQISYDNIFSGFHWSWAMFDHSLVPIRSFQMLKRMYIELFSRPHLFYCFVSSSWFNLSNMSLLQVIVPLLVTEDEKTLVACINCLTKVRFMNYTVYSCFSEIVNTKSHVDIIVRSHWNSFIGSCVQLVGRLSQEELMDQLSSFLPAVFEAFGSQSADVRKVKELKKKTWLFYSYQ